MKSSKSELESNNTHTTGPAECGEGCACNSTQGGGKGFKLVLSLGVVTAVAGILIYKNIQAKDTVSPDAADTESTFLAEQKSPGLNGNTSDQIATAESADQSDNIKNVDSDVEWLSLKSLSDLNTAAATQDAVFIFIPNSDGDVIADNSIKAVTAAQASMKQRKITLGLYTLSASSPDYSGIVAQVQPPAILVASKGGSMAPVSGEVSETKLLQAFMTTKSSGCGPAGCGPAGCK
ncbi:MAG: hypothetical protein PF904_01280 [Kiritimatiellae bacterium]|jgi:hypothetical protein|nr:hypothetical protein [Kiritimatiellia bacterium]